jgi:hypothetical protein
MLEVNIISRIQRTTLMKMKSFQSINDLDFIPPCSAEAALRRRSRDMISVAIRIIKEMNPVGMKYLNQFFK